MLDFVSILFVEYLLRERTRDLVAYRRRHFDRRERDRLFDSALLSPARAIHAVSGATAGALSSPFLIHETADAGKVESRAGFCAFHELA